MYAAVLIPCIAFNMHLPSKRGENSQAGHIRQSLRIVFLSLLGKNPGDVPRPEDSLKLVVFWSSFTGFVFISLYRAMLGASLAIKIEHKPFASIEDLAASSRKVILEDQSFIHEYVVNGSGSSLTKLNNPNLVPTNFIDHPKAAFEKMLNSTWKNSILLGQRSTLEQLPEYPCNITHLDFVAIERWLGLVYQKNRPYAKLFDWHLMSIVRDTGLFKKLYQRHVGHATICPASDMDATTMSQTVFIFALLGTGVLATLCTLSIEILSKRRRHSTTGHQYICN